MGGGARAPRPTAQERALERRQQIELDEEIAKSERRFKSLTRGKLGARSLLAGVPRGGKTGFLGPKGVYQYSPTAAPRSQTESDGG